MNKTHKIRVNILFNLLLYVLVSTTIYSKILIYKNHKIHTYGEP